MMAGIRFEGVAELTKGLKLKITLNNVKRIVRFNGAELERKMQRAADFKKGYQSGTTKRSIHTEITDGGLTAEVGPETEYSYYLEVGTRFMEAQPFVRPPWEAQKEKFKQDLQKLVR